MRPDVRQGMWAFGLIWIGQVVSLVGSGLTEFGLGVWVFQHTGAATDYALIALCISLPHVLVAPLAGTLVDRTDRRRVMLLSDSAAALSTLAVALLAWGGRLEVWHVYAAVLATSTCAAVQYPAYAALVMQLVPKEHLGRANGLVELAWSASLIVAPLAAAALIAVVGLPGVLMVDLLTFGVGFGTLLLARVPSHAPERIAEPDAMPDATPFGVRVRAGWAYIAARPGLAGLLVFSAVMSLSAGTFNALFAPMILSTEPASVLGGLASLGGCGMLTGGLLLAAWGGPRRRIVGVIGTSLLFSLALVVIGAHPSWLALAVAVVLYFGCQPVLNGCEQTLWQSAVPDHLLGRVLSARRAVEHGVATLAYLGAGPLADRLVEPLLAPGGVLAPTVGAIIGVGAGRGIGLMLVVMGLVALLTTIASGLSARLRVEDGLPDVDGHAGNDGQTGNDRQTGNRVAGSKPSAPALEPAA
ncbi:MAG: MFS transporter [Chloroflexi bacterium]|nr:MFS transporter [Chloroflexota bacterium]